MHRQTARCCRPDRHLLLIAALQDLTERNRTLALFASHILAVRFSVPLVTLESVSGTFEPIVTATLTSASTVASLSVLV